jgi:hypothetical protein
MSLHFDGAADEIVIYPDFSPLIEIDGLVEIERRIVNLSGVTVGVSVVTASLGIS